MAEVNFLVKKGLTVPKGSASTPSVIFDASDPNTGLYSPGADQVAVATNGVGRLFVDASGSISTSSTAWQGESAYQLGGLQIGASTYAKALLQTGGTSRAEWLFDSADNYLLAKSGSFYIFNTTANPITFATNGSERLRITSAGLVGIGTSSPGTRLHVTQTLQGNDVSTGAAMLMTTSTATNDRLNLNFSLTGINDRVRAGIGAVALDSTGGYNCGLAFYTRNQPDGSALAVTDERMRIDSSGRVGIGTTSPLSPLAVSNGSNKNIEFQPGSTCYLLAYDRTASDYLDLDITAENLIFSTNNGTERARIDSSGRLLVGTTSAQGSAILQTDSTTLGFLPPRMTTAQRDAISSPAAGLMVYNTSTNKLNFYNGTAWEAVTSA